MMDSNIYKHTIRIISVFVIIIFVTSGRNILAKRAVLEVDSKDNFILPTVPSSLQTPESRAIYISKHYWDNFNFKDTLSESMVSITEQAFVDYLTVLGVPGNTAVNESLYLLLASAEKEYTGNTYKYFVELLEKYLYEPESPYRNDEFYIPVAKYIINDSLSDSYSKERIKYNLGLMLKNRAGKKASDFTYTLVSNESNTLYNTKDTPYQLVLFYVPGCYACEESIYTIKNSYIINNSLEKKRLSILAICPNNDIDVWVNYSNNIPSSWINSYDKTQIINHQQIYDLRRTPSLYLLDRNNIILLKNPRITDIENYFIESDKITDLSRVSEQS